MASSGACDATGSDLELGRGFIGILDSVVRNNPYNRAAYNMRKASQFANEVRLGY